jgi:hypothetical protein
MDTEKTKLEVAAHNARFYCQFRDDAPVDFDPAVCVKHLLPGGNR